jgi:hypothetical protein
MECLLTLSIEVLWRYFNNLKIKQSRRARLGRRDAFRIVALYYVFFNLCLQAQQVRDSCISRR